MIETPELESGVVTPCREPDADPDDWFIPHNPSPDEYGAPGHSHPTSETCAECAPLLREALRRRRGAKQACWDCPTKARMECLQIGMSEGFGIFGGYDERERREFERKR